MSFADVPADTDAQKIIAGIDVLAHQLTDVENRADQLTQAVNATGAQVQWLIDNLQGIFAVVNSPAFRAQIMGALTGGMPTMMEGMLNAGPTAAANGAVVPAEHGA